MLEKNDKQSMESVTRIKSKVKIVFLGQQSTGKTSILMRFLNDKFQESQNTTVGIDFMGKNFTINNHHLRLQLWDTAGQQRFRSLIPSYLKDAIITMIVFDLASKDLVKQDQKTLENINEWVDLCTHNRNDKNIIVFLGNKKDLVQAREITNQAIQQKLCKYGKKFFEVSAKTGQGIQDVFNYACSQFVKANVLEAQMTFSKINEQMRKRFSFQNSHSALEQNSKSLKKDKTITIRKDSPHIKEEMKKKKRCC